MPVTFRADNVPQHKASLENCSSIRRLYETIPNLHEFGAFEAGSPLTNLYVGHFSSHPVIDAALRAYDQHLGVTFTPDCVWQLIVQAVSRHITTHSEALRSRLVKHQGKLELVVRRDEFVLGSPDNDWPGFVAAINELIGKESQPAVKRMIDMCRFTTTGPVEEACAGIAVMDAVKAYYDYTCVTMCGIPHVTLEGTPEDWYKIRRGVRVVEDLVMPELAATWLPILDGVLVEFERAAQGQANSGFWAKMVSKHETHGSGAGIYVSGWLNVFFPEETSGNTINSYMLPEKFSDLSHRDGRSINSFGTGLSTVPVLWKYYFSELPLMLVGGFAGFQLDEKSDGLQSLRPCLAWSLLHVKKPGAEPSSGTSRDSARLPPPPGTRAAAFVQNQWEDLGKMWM
eukprot:gnl/Hemi2/16406_TR5474_c0_g1_i1.p1 gnl/Hemi2/16406_TR5474_c0_g1~~gnl/Hemi2/16406_TR5474_c0_g1_i1.p1  ORF type:complete len:411 (+),score=58.66 gnl/Hemi2/16406_TR5474_c0_g1_i1:39-1235(+)